MLEKTVDTSGSDESSSDEDEEELQDDEGSSDAEDHNKKIEKEKAGVVEKITKTITRQAAPSPSMFAGYEDEDEQGTLM